MALQLRLQRQTRFWADELPNASRSQSQVTPQLNATTTQSKHCIRPLSRLDNTNTHMIKRRIFLQQTLFALAGASLFSLAGCAVAQTEAESQMKPNAGPTGEMSAYRNRSKVGVNLMGVHDWSTETPFADLFKSSRAWISQTKGAAWGEGPALELRADGYPARLAPDSWAETPTLTFDDAPLPQGEYVLVYQGQGEVEVGNGVPAKDATPGRLTFTPKPGAGKFSLRIKATDPADPVRDVRVFLPGQSEAKSLFNPRFTQFLRPFGTLRFMDWGATNGNPLQKWSERPQLGDARWSGDKGAPIEAMVDLCNQTGSDMWITLPHGADDDYFRRAAELVKERLAPSSKIYVEYSNEVWNGAFKQAKYAAERGTQLGLSNDANEARARFYAQRTVEMGRIWREVFGAEAAKRLTVVAAAQAGNPNVARQILSWKDTAREVDALAIAPYFGNKIGDPKRQNEVSRWSVDQLLDELEQEVKGDNKTKSIEPHAQIAKQYGLKLLAYEGGQHLVARGNNEKQRELFFAANRDPRMAQLYREHLDNWFAAGGDAYVLFASVGRQSKSGSWGLAEYLDQPLADAPKLRGVVEFVERGEIAATG